MMVPGTRPASIRKGDPGMTDGTGMSPKSPQFRSAQRAGKKYRPDGGS
jgi:hypothetical protein